MSREAAAALSDTELETRLYPSAEATVSAQRLAVDCPEVHQQLEGKSVTLQLLWRSTGSASRWATATTASVSCTGNGGSGST